jgi:hypothetical protein
VIAIFNEAHSNCVVLFIFNQSSVHVLLETDARHAFDINKSNGGGQRKQKDTIILMNNPCAEFWGKPQKMTTMAGEAKGLKQMLEEWGFNTQGMHTKCCSPVCPIENTSCCMAHLLSKQDDFYLQESLLEQKIKAKGHLCVFLPKFHCELNLIEMVCFFLHHIYCHVNYV